MIREKAFTITIRTKEPLRIGGKKDPLSGADNPVTRVGGKLVVPGSTLKGALRSKIEEFLIDSYFSNGRWKSDFEHFMPCIPGAELSGDEKLLVGAGKYRDQGGTCRYPCTDRNCGRDVKHSICPVCYLLGSMGLNGFSRVPFLSAEGSASELYSSRMDRGTKTIATGSNRPYELVPSETVFQGQLFVLLEDTVLNWKLGEPRNVGETRTLGDRWLEGNQGKMMDKTQIDFINTYVIERLRSIKLLGGYKSKGFGMIEVTVNEGSS
jgi:CRISPR/Cas system CSM-associated protein Csm3 (group 7 of RAMP superfamily)